MKIKDNTGNELLIHERGVNLILASDKVERRIFQVQGGQLVKYVKPQNIKKEIYVHNTWKEKIQATD